MRCQWNDDENDSLRKVPWRARVVYLQGIRWKMDYRTGIAGMSAVVSYQQLHDVLTCSEAGSTKPDPDINKEGLRAIFRMLERAGLIEWVKHAGKGLVFKCVLADTDQSAQKEDNPKTTPRQPQEDNPSEPSDCNGCGAQDNPKTTPRHPPEDNPPPYTGNRKERGVNTPVDLSAKRGADERVLTVFDYWRQVMAHPRAKLDAKRKKAIAARLRDGYSVEYIKSAIDGCKGSAYHQGKNAQHSIYDDIELICREASKLDRFANMASKAPQRDNELDEWINDDRIIEGNFNVIG